MSLSHLPCTAHDLEVKSSDEPFCPLIDLFIYFFVLLPLMSVGIMPFFSFDQFIPFESYMFLQVDLVGLGFFPA